MITSLLSEGTNDLLRHGHAIAITSALDLLDALGIGELPAAQAE